MAHTMTLTDIIERDFALIRDRDINPKEKSYTNYLLGEGVDKICKKIGEESAEVIVAVKNGNPQELTTEVADLAYHLLVLMYIGGVTPQDVAEELYRRSKDGA